MKKKKKALTLLELLIVSSISAVIMVSIYAAFRTGTFGYRDIQNNIKVYQAARQILERINTDLRNAFAYSNNETKFKGDTNGISFLTLVDTFSRDKITQDYAFVSYKLEGNTLMRLCRKNKDALNDKSEVAWQEFGSNIKEITFSYGFLLPGQPLQWKDLWDNPLALPVAVKVKLVFQNRAQEFQRQIFLTLAE